MIGQKKLLNNIDKMVLNGFPRFTIICGPKGSGKKLIAKHIANNLNAQLIVSGTKVDNVRDIILLSYKQTVPTVYLLPDCDKMSSAAKNALLKVTEEPPRKAYFIMTLSDVNNTLTTLKSRGTVLNINDYSFVELLDYAESKQYELNDEEQTIVSNICTVPGDVDTLMKYDAMAFYNYVNLVVSNIGTVSGANAFKIGQKLSYKEDDGGWDITLFMRAIMFSYLELAKQGKQSQKCQQSIKVVSKYLSQINTTGINKSATIDMMVLELRGIWVED